MMHNNLFVHRLLILTENNETAYDEIFHKGVNIIRGDNSSGKSTITHFIFFVLGGGFGDFVLEAKQCSVVLAEVEMNGAVFTIKRFLEKNEDNGSINTKAPIYFFWGAMEESFNSDNTKVWEKFGYNTTENRKSFSNVFFENLGLPVVKGDSNITMHQVLRLLYIDQESPTSSLFYYEYFDSQLTRETVSDLLLGVYDETLYENKKRLLVAEKELEEVKNELKVTEKFFADPLTLDPNHIRAIITNREEEIKKIENEIIEIRNKDKQVNYGKKTKLDFEILNQEVIKQRIIIRRLEERTSQIDSEIVDSQYFIEALNNKIRSLKNSINTREFLGGLPLEYCPECLTHIEKNDDNTRCKLCKEKIDESFGIVQARRMELEIGYQISESQKLLELSKREKMELSSKYEAEKIKMHHLQQQVNSALKDVKSFNQEVLDRLNKDKGFIEGEILQFRTTLENAELYKTLRRKRLTLEEEIFSLKRYINNAELKQAELKEKISNIIKQEGLYLLNNDLDRQEEFKNANEFFIDFANNITFLSNKYSKYSASSNFYLKVTARFAIFLASLKIKEMRFPRFIFADNMEDKGIEPKRAQNLQNILIDRVKNYDPNTFQIIYTTSYISEELNSSPYVVGEYYTKDNHSLKNIKKNKFI